MPRMLAAIVLVVLLMEGTSEATVAGLQNPGFETGDFSGWSVLENGEGYAIVMEKYWDYADKAYYATEGDCFALLIAGGPEIPIVVYQSVHLVQGQTLAGTATFKAFDSIDDWAAVRIYDNDGFIGDHRAAYRAQPWYRDVGSVGSYGSSPWEYWSWEAPAAGDYWLWYGVANYLDADNQSQAGFDTVPVPPSLLLLGTGLLGLFGIRRRRMLRLNP